MNSQALVTTNEDLETHADTIGTLQAARANLGSADIERVAEIRVWARAVHAAATAKRAAAVAREAMETQIRAERQLGRLLEEDRSLASAVGISHAAAGTFIDLATMPDRLWEATITDLLDRGKVCSTQHVINNARRSSLKKIEPGIWRAYDSRYFTLNSGGRVSLSWHQSLEDVREELRIAAGLSKRWRGDPSRTRLDEAHARARRLAQQLGLLAETLGGEARRRVEAAELLQATVAEELFAAYRLESLHEDM